MTAVPTDSQATNTFVSSVASPLGDIGFSNSLYQLNVPDGWGTWSNGYTGDIYTQQSYDPVTFNYIDVTLTLPAGTTAFYLYAEPQLFGPFMITATANDGTTLSQSPNGDAGAEGYGFYGSDLATITIDADPNAWGYAVGEFGISQSAPARFPNPPPSSFGRCSAVSALLSAGSAGGRPRSPISSCQNNKAHVESGVGLLMRGVKMSMISAPFHRSSIGIGSLLPWRHGQSEGFQLQVASQLGVQVPRV